MGLTSECVLGLYNCSTPFQQLQQDMRSRCGGARTSEDLAYCLDEVSKWLSIFSQCGCHMVLISAKDKAHPDSEDPEVLQR